MDLIDRDRVLALPRNQERTLSGKVVAESVDVALIEALPSAEPERRTGKWIYLGDGYKCPWSCSNCSSCSDERTDYCPMCGVKMGDNG